MTCPSVVGLFSSKWEDLSFYISTVLASCIRAIRGRQLHGYLEACRISTEASLNGKQMAVGAHPAGLSRRSLAGVGLFESVRSHGPGLALLTHGDVQQQQTFRFEIKELNKYGLTFNYFSIFYVVLKCHAD
ncbi:hypothetical protein TNCV_4747541 [Trichonephila clavipes]|nr:hypothetical protein TNCV_4747541 [Trichonephila clavipes]